MLEKVVQRVETIRSRPLLEGLVVTFLVVGVAIHAVAEWLIHEFGAIPTAILSMGVAVLLFLFWAPLESLIQFFLSSRQGEIEVEAVPGFVRRHRGLIVLSSVGQGIGSAESAILYHWQGSKKEHTEPVLEVCWIITGGAASEQSATGLIKKLVQDGIPAKIWQLKTLSAENADNPEAVHQLVDEIYREAKEKYRLDEEDVIADYTGGTKSMTSGIVLACTSPRRPLQFMKPRKYDADGRAEPQAGADPVAIDIRFELVPKPQHRQGSKNN